MTLPTTVNVSRPRAAGYDAALGTLLLRLAFTPGKHPVMSSAPLEPP